MLLGQVNRFKINKHTPRAIVLDLALHETLSLQRNYKTGGEEREREEEDPSGQTEK